MIEVVNLTGTIVNLHTRILGDLILLLCNGLFKGNRQVSCKVSTSCADTSKIVNLRCNVSRPMCIGGRVSSVAKSVLWTAKTTRNKGKASSADNSSFS